MQRLIPRGKWIADTTRAGAELSGLQQRSEPSDESAQGTVSKLGHSVCGDAGVCPALSVTMAKQNPARRRASPSGAVLSTPGWNAGFAAPSTRRIVDREPETRGGESIAPDSLHRSDPGRSVGGLDTDAASFPEQTTTVEIQWSGSGDARQRPTSFCGRATAALQKAAAYSWFESRSQPRDEGYLQEYGYGRYSLCGTVPGFLRRFASQGDEAGDGSSHARTQDRSHYVDTLEEGRTFRRRTFESASSLSVKENPVNSPGFITRW